VSIYGLKCFPTYIFTADPIKAGRSLFFCYFCLLVMVAQTIRVYVYIIPVWRFNTSQQVVVLLFFQPLVRVSFINARLSFPSPHHAHNPSTTHVTNIHKRTCKTTETRSSRGVRTTTNPNRKRVVVAVLARE